jgi:hypothetical protein
MTDQRQALKPPFDLKTLFGGKTQAAAGAATAAAAVAAGGHDLPDDIAERCRRMGLEVQWETLKPVHNIMRPCRGEIDIPPCRDVELPDLRPRVYVFWGDSPCDCIEGDDTEIMFVLVYNPYRNMSLCDVEINRIRVVDAGGNDVPKLPDGSASVQLVPRGKYCFGDLPPCGIAFRQFVLRLRGAPPGPYRILIEGICFELCLHRMTEECVTFDVCKD